MRTIPTNFVFYSSSSGFRMIVRGNRKTWKILIHWFQMMVTTVIQWLKIKNLGSITFGAPFTYFHQLKKFQTLNDSKKYQFHFTLVYLWWKGKIKIEQSSNQITKTPRLFRFLNNKTATMRSSGLILNHVLML
jgi:hypothetical protein